MEGCHINCRCVRRRTTLIRQYDNLIHHEARIPITIVTKQRATKWRHVNVIRFPFTLIPHSTAACIVQMKYCHTDICLMSVWKSDIECSVHRHGVSWRTGCLSAYVAVSNITGWQNRCMLLTECRTPYARLHHWNSSPLLTLRRLMSYIYGAPILDVSRSHTTTQHGR